MAIPSLCRTQGVTFDGTVRSLHVKSIETFGDGSIGVQVSKPVGTIVIENGIS